MIPTLYQANITPSNIDTVPMICKLSDTMTCVVTEERNGEYSLDLTYPINGINADKIASDLIIKVKAGDRAGVQPFRITSVKPSLSGKTIEVHANHLSYDLCYYPVKPFSTQAIYASLAANHVWRNSILSCPFTPSFENYQLSEAMKYITDVPKSMRSMLLGEEYSFLDYFGGEFEWDNFTVKWYSGRQSGTSRGADNGVVISYGKNIIDADRDIDSSDMVCGILPYYTSSDTTLASLNTVSGDNITVTAFDNITFISKAGGTVHRYQFDYNSGWKLSGSAVTLSEYGITVSGTPANGDYIVVVADHVLYGDIQYINDYSAFPFPKVMCKDYSEDPNFDESNPPTVAKLNARAAAFIRDNNVGTPRISTEVEFFPSWGTPDNEKFKALEHVNLCDTVTVIIEGLNIATKVKVVKTQYNALLERYNSMSLGAIRQNAADLLASALGGSTSYGGGGSGGSTTAGVSSWNGMTGAVTYTAPVTSVNGSTGDVVVDVPSKTSDLTNDSGFITDAGVTSFNGSTGAVTYTAPVTSVNGSTGAVTVSVPSASTSSPLMDGTASAGSGTAYARGNHRHPTDTSRASQADLETLQGTVQTNTQTIENVANSVPGASSTSPKMDGTAAVGTETAYARGDHIHPTDTSRAPTNHASSATTYGVGSDANYGHVKLSSSTTSDSGIYAGVAATPAAVKAVKDAIPTKVSQLNNDSGYITDPGVTSVNGSTGDVTVAPEAHASNTTDYGVGTSALYGHVKLSASTSSTSGTTKGIAATPSAVKAVNDAKVAKAGDHMTGELLVGTSSYADKVGIRATTDGRGNVRVWDASGNLQLNLYALASSGGEVDVNDTAGQTRGSLYVGTDGGGRLSLKDSSGNSAVMSKSDIDNLQALSSSSVAISNTVLTAFTGDSCTAMRFGKVVTLIFGGMFDNDIVFGTPVTFGTLPTGYRPMAAVTSRMMNNLGVPVNVGIDTSGVITMSALTEDVGGNLWDSMTFITS